MASNIEIKARCPDLTKARRIAESLGAKFSQRQRQRDTYFCAKAGRLKLREIDGAAWLIPYLRPDEAGDKRSDYELIAVVNPTRVRELFAKILGVSIAVEKAREIYLLDNVRIHLDEVAGLGCFIEFEAVFDSSEPTAESANRAKIQELIRAFELAHGDLLRGSYHEMLQAKQ